MEIKLTTNQASLASDTVEEDIRNGAWTTRRLEVECSLIGVDLYCDGIPIRRHNARAVYRRDRWGAAPCPCDFAALYRRGRAR